MKDIFSVILIAVFLEVCYYLPLKKAAKRGIEFWKEALRWIEED